MLAFLLSICMALAAMPITSAAPTSMASTNYTTAISSLPAPGPYTLLADYSGTNFFSGFTTFTGADPTSGNVNYTDLATAAADSLVGYIYNATSNSTNVYLGVDHTHAQANRNSVRLLSKATFDVGIVVTFDLIHVPVAFGAWPALWLLGNLTDGVWPGSNGGEIDVFEVVHEFDFNSMTLHTGPGCSVDNSTTTFQGQLQNADCNHESGGDGCSVQALSQAHTPTHGVLATAGAGFNAQGGGVYVLHWTTTGVTVHPFPRDALPSDLAAGKPNPATWKTKPLAAFGGQGCAFDRSLQRMQIITDTTFCGQWAGKAEVWAQLGKTGAGGSCEEFVRDKPGAFGEAYFEIAGIRVYGDGRGNMGVAGSAKRDAVEPAEVPVVDLAERVSVRQWLEEVGGQDLFE